MAVDPGSGRVGEAGRPDLAGAFAARFGGPPTLLARAPGRVNLIGEHTDYNDGFVLPLAIDRASWIALRPRDDRRLRVASLLFDETVEVDLDALERGKPGWAEYVKGTAWALLEEGDALRGWDGVVWGDVPLGAGLSSSASLELATARACAAASGLPWDPKRMARRAQRAENGWVGMNCGIMDQLVSAAAEADAALLIDCRSLATSPVPLPSGIAVAVLDTATRRGLVDSAYNERRAQCEAAAQALGVSALRDVSAEQLAAAGLHGLVLKRARHVVTEDDRTLRFAELLRLGKAEDLGPLLDASHESLRDDFEVSSPALDAMVRCARKDPACLGARMTGGGFGGCAVALVRDADADGFLSRVLVEYERQAGVVPKGYLCRASAGASLERLA